MSINYNSTLQNNNAGLQTILNTINQLPEAGGGGTQATPVISVSSNGLITATAGTKSSTYQLAFQPAKTITPSTSSQVAVSSGYYTGGDITVAAVQTQTKTVTPSSTSQNVTPDSGKFLSKVTVSAIPSTYIQPSATKGATTYMPSTTDQTIAAGTYLTGMQTIKGDANFIESNIKNGITMFGKTGTYVGSGGSGGNTDIEDALVTRTISTYTNDRVKNIGIYAFFYNTRLTSVNFPACTHIENSAFNSCTSLTSVSFPVCKIIGNAAFQSCTRLTSVSFPVCTYIDEAAFQRCTSLTSVSFPACTYIAKYAFNCCYNLVSIYLRGSSVCKLSASYAFQSTPIGGYSASAGRYGSIFVPASLVDAYKTATNWTYFADRIVAMPDDY